MLAPCIIVLSRSKNAAALGSAGVVRAVSTSAAAAAASPARVERCLRFSGLRLFSGVTGATLGAEGSVPAREHARFARSLRPFRPAPPDRKRPRPLWDHRPHAQHPRRVLTRG